MTKNRKNAECRYDKEHRRLHRGETVRGDMSISTMISSGVGAHFMPKH